MTSRQTRLRQAQAETDKLFQLLADGAIYERPIPERHRLIFYLGHFDAFDWNQLCRASLGMRSFHPTFDKLFEAGIDPEPGKAPQDQAHDWPRVDEVLAYVQRIREYVYDAVTRAPNEIFETVLEHRLMHAETFAYLLHELPHAFKHGRVDEPVRCPAPGQELVELPGGTAVIGQEHGKFGWDNEFDQHKVEVSAFRMARYKVTNGEYLHFVREGATAPHFWALRWGKWYWRGMFDYTPLDHGSPVYVTHAEATAYARWKGAALITEPQFHRAASDVREDVTSMNVGFLRWDPVPVNADQGLQLIGNGWEWTSTRFAPFPGFRPFAHYPGYSEPFFDGEHYVLKGGSPRTAKQLLRPSFRNWFRHEYPYVYGTFRLVRD
ncbi:MAG TPA: SUMF1/EgtB/PvdO family nonheme iron enzyme [Bryobacteraceae bacterium]|nr:SUMF1/EgtB/PvdO family nonheme iron enzyme [Bryobacteraceae bacterium]